jgi:hypothetical protein
MALIVGVHGIAQQFKAPPVLRTEWEPSLRGGVELAGGHIPDGSLACASYGQVFRRPGVTRGAGDVHYIEDDVTAEEAALLFALLDEAARAEPERFPRAAAMQRARAPKSVQAALRLLCRSRFLAEVAARAFIGDLKQVTGYISETEVRQAAIAAVDDAVREDTRIIIAHSLGTVVAYEALHANAGNPRWANVRTFITLGSPLGIRNLIFDALDPPPSDGLGRWPPGITRWTNISDDGDIVALDKRLAPLFGGDLIDIGVHNGATAHDVRPYLTARETGRAILDGLA